MCSAERGQHALAMHMLGPPLGNVRSVHIEQAGWQRMLGGEGKKLRRVQSKENRVRRFGMAREGEVPVGSGGFGLGGTGEAQWARVWNSYSIL